jgi:hypothetical protein
LGFVRFCLSLLLGRHITLKFNLLITYQPMQIYYILRNIWIELLERIVS